MDFGKVKYVYLIGIGGIGMSALARYFKAMGKVVSGYDRTSTELTDELVSENISVHFNDELTQLPEYCTTASDEELLIIYTPAIPKEHKGYNFFKANRIIYKRSQVLGFLTKNSKTIAVAGTHGKTTTSTLIAHLLKFNGINCSAFLGGISKNYNTNLILGDFSNPEHYIVVEADEFDRSFLTLFPFVAIITSMDADHLDIYGDHLTLIECYNQFATQVNKNGLLIFKKDLPLITVEPKAVSYSITAKAFASAQNIQVVNHNYQFEYVNESVCYTDLTLGLPGRHNVENAIAAITVASFLGLNEKQISDGLKSYSGVKRRFDFQINTEKLVFIDDYAHHPEELTATILSVKELYPDKKITVVFQPHLYSRTKDFAAEFSESLSIPDETILLPIYPARELPIEGVDAEMIAKKITTKNIVCQKSELLNYVKQSKPELLLTLGAGDIDQLIQPLKQMLLNN